MGSGRLGSGFKGSASLGERKSEQWEIDPEEIQIMRRPDGSPWLLGEGASGTVRRPKFYTTCRGLSKLKRFRAEELEFRTCWTRAPPARCGAPSSFYMQGSQ